MSRKRTATGETAMQLPILLNDLSDSESIRTRLPVKEWFFRRMSTSSPYNITGFPEKSKRKNAPFPISGGFKIIFRNTAKKFASRLFYHQGEKCVLIIRRDGTIYPTEFKKSATPDRKDARHFDELVMFKQPVATGAVVSLYPQKTHLREDVLNLPATWL